jgi:hypothetical protein
VIREDAGRLILCCDRCAVRLDLGIADAVRARNRTPSGWMRTGADKHCCPLCSATVRVAPTFTRIAGVRAQPLF